MDNEIILKENKLILHIILITKKYQKLHKIKKFKKYIHYRTKKIISQIMAHKKIEKAIKFFKKLYKKIPKYLRRFLMELVMITIGVGIALQFGKWQDEIKTKEREIQALKSLKIDFETRLEDLDSIQSGRHRVMESMEAVLTQINNKKLTITDSVFVKHLWLITAQLTYNDESTAMDLLYSTGQINEISDMRLRKLLISWPYKAEEMLEEQRLYIDNLEDLRDVLFKYIIFDHLFVNYNISQEKLESKIDEAIFEKKYEKLIRNLDFANILSEQRLYLKVNLKDGDTLIDNAQNIIKYLDEEISNNEK